MFVQHKTCKFTLIELLFYNIVYEVHVVFLKKKGGVKEALENL